MSPELTAGNVAVTYDLHAPDGPELLPLVFIGHGLGQDRSRPYPLDLVQRLTSRGVAVVAVDAPEHGERRNGERSDVPERWTRYWARAGAAQIAAEHAALIDVMSADRRIDATRVGYFGLSLATQYGLGVLAKEPRISAAVLGLFGLPEPGLRMRDYAPKATCPVFFIRQLDDEIHSAASTQALFDIIGSRDKTLRSSAGGHVAVPEVVFEEACGWLAEKLREAR